MNRDELIDEINRLKMEKDALILAHYYVDGDIQDIADYVGDSYGLSKKVIDSDKKRIVFCGVKFMGESAKILNPEKKVYLVENDALCPMADMVDREDIECAREKYDNLYVVSYINSSADTKRYSDICITSSNALDIIEKIDSNNILMIPDKNLGTYVKEKIKDKNIILHDGYCYVHEDIDRVYVEAAKEEHPKAEILVHPECNPSVFSLANYIGSTAGILNYVKNSDTKEFIICTEKGILHKLSEDNPDKSFYFTDRDQTCRDMKKIDLEKLRDVLKYDKNEVIIDDLTMGEAKIPLMRMMEYGSI